MLAGGLALAGGVGLRWDPLGLGERRLTRAEARATTAEAAAVRSAATLAAERALTPEREVSAARVAAANASLDPLILAAEGASDGRTPLDPDRLHRLREHDRRLCELAAHLEGCGDVEPAGRGDATLSAGAAGA